MQQAIKEPIHHAPVDAVFFAQRASKCQQYGNIDEAIKYVKLAIICDPSNDQYLHMLGVIYHHQDNNEEAISCFKKAISINNTFFTCFFNLGLVYKKINDTEKSLTAQRKALALSSNNLPCLNEIGLLATTLQQFDEAEVALQKAFQLDPDHVTTCINLSHLYVQKKCVREAIDFGNKAMLIDPNRPEPYCNIGTAFIIAGVISEGVDYLRIAVSLSSKPHKASFTHQSILMNMLYADCYSPESIFLEHKNWADTHLNQKLASDVHTTRQTKKNKILNVGFISADFNDHSIYHFLIPLLENIDQTELHIICYSSIKKTDKFTENFKQLSGAWRDISNNSEEDIVNIIQHDNIDILIDLAGHSLGTHISVFAHKPAPIQMTYLGYPFSSGLKSMDYRITDSFTDPKNSAEHLHTEKLLRINPSFLCYKPEIETPISENLPVDKNGYITFGSFNNVYKLSQSTIQTWANILISVPKSIIFLKSSRHIPDGLRDTILSTFEEYGVKHDRVFLHYATTTKAEHMALYNGIDICLDPFPYNGTTTTYEALSMGVPVITLTGDSHHSRVGSGILNGLNLSQLASDSLKNYVSIATELAADTNTLRKYRESLRPKLLSSPLTDSKMYAKKFETLLKNAWGEYCDNSKPVTLKKSALTSSKNVIASPMEKPEIAIIYHLARTGGTLISKCIGSIEGNILLSEINPTMSVENPLDQASNWFQLINETENENYKTFMGYTDAIRLIYEKSKQKNKKLIIRDWSHINFTGVPYLNHCSYQLSQADALNQYFTIKQIATVRHPVDSFISLLKFGVVPGNIDLDKYLSGAKAFAIQASDMGFIKYEDFCLAPEKQLVQICQKLNINYNADFIEKFSRYSKITGDTIGAQTDRNTIEIQQRKNIDKELEKRFMKNQDYWEILDILNYGDYFSKSS